MKHVQYRVYDFDDKLLGTLEDSRDLEKHANALWGDAWAEIMPFGPEERVQCS